MPAVIESTLYDAPPPGGSIIAGSTQQNSRDDLQLGYHVALNSVQAATTYAWTLSFASDSPGTTVPGTPFDGTSSASALLPPENSTSRTAKFNVDYEGTYLIRLTVDAGLPTENSQFIRCRVLTLFGSLKLVAAGERRDENGVIPVDATPEGWANDQNANIQRVAILLRRLSQSGRVLYVDANRGRDISQDQDDYDNVISIPGPEVAREEATGIKLRAMAHGDFSSINQAITYAAAAAARGEPAPSKSQPYFIVVRRGLYEEDLNLTSFVHIIGDEEPFEDEQRGGGDSGSTNHQVRVRSVNTAGTGTHSYNPLGLHTAQECFLVNLALSGTANVTLPVLDHLGGLLRLLNCSVSQEGDSVTQGEAYRCVVSNAAHAPALWAEKTNFVSEATTADWVALRFDGVSGYCWLLNSVVDAQSCDAVAVNETRYLACEFHALQGTFISGLGGYEGYGSLQSFTDSTVEASAGAAIDVNPFGGGAASKAGDVLVEVTRTTLSGVISFSTLGAIGTTSLSTSAVDNPTSAAGTHVVFPDAPGDVPDTWRSTLDAETLRYHPQHGDPLLGPAAPPSVNVLNQLPKTNVQEAIDILVQAVFPVLGSPFYSLGSGYNGLATLNPPTPGVGLGRTIAALGGAVQITGGTAPLALDSHLKHGGIQAEGVVDIGGLINGGATDNLVDVGHSEISLNPNMMGAGPFISLGRATWTNGISGGDRGFGGAVVLADASGAGSSYNLHLRTAHARTSGTGKAGNVYMLAGSISVPAGADDAGDVHIIAGSHANIAKAPGDIYLVPGLTAAPDQGVVWFMGSGTLPASLEADNAYVGGVAGTIYIGTPDGVEGFTFTGAETTVMAVAIFNTGRGIRALENPAGFITLYSDFAASGDLVYAGDSTAGTTNTALGDFRPTFATFTPAVYGNQVSVDVPINNRLRVNGDLEVTGIIIGGGPVFGAYVDVTFVMSAYTVLTGDGILSVDSSGGAVVIDLPAALIAGKLIVIKNVAGRNGVVITPGGGDTIEGAATFVLTADDGLGGVAAGHGVAIYKDSGTDWKIWAEYKAEITKVRHVTASRVWDGTERYDIYSCQLVLGVDIDITLAANHQQGRKLYIKDENGIANIIAAPFGQRVHITDAAAGTFDGAAFLDLNTLYGAATLYKNAAGNWSVV